MKKALALLIMAASLTACHQNPFLQEWDTPYGIPPFEKIKVSDYIPAVKAGIEQQQAEIAAIVANPAEPTFENTIAPLELSGSILSKVVGVLYNVSETDQTPELDAVLEEAIPLMSDHSAEISFNKGLYKRVAAVYYADQSGLTREQQMVLKKHFEGFERDGIGLPEDLQLRLKQIDSDLAVKTQKIGNNILAESNAFKEKFGISVSEYPTAMTTTEDRELRKAMFEAYTTRGHHGNENDNCALLLDVLRLRARKASILGYPDFASYQLANKMAGDPQTVDGFLADIMAAAVKSAKAEIYDMEQIAGHEIEPWDWWYYAEKVRKAKYDLDDDQIRPYFKIDNVVKGIFTAAHTLYGINAELIEGVPSYNPKVVKTYKITDAEGALVGIFTTDYHPRSSKRGGAWMNNIREQYVDADGNEIRPIIVNVANMPEYLTVDDVQTVFHEFGHALHGLLTKCHYPSVSGTNVTRDFVEMFSQFNENWAFQPWLLEQYAVNDKGEVIPAELVEKINGALKFNQGFMTTELAAASILDMKWHELSAIPEDVDPAAFIDEFEAKVCKEMGLIKEIVPRYRTTYFNHIFSSGYSAGYYGYLWSEVLDKDAFSIFEKECVGPDGQWDMAKTVELAGKFKATFLERGGSEEPMTLYKSFAGREPDSKPMLRGRGLLN
ncbi:MAG: M3 family metallopeptidase [Bacteroidales bacterium]|nr:M3 family metallopeptidase [Bacteroidales bacterium]